jgi:membrane protein implicated in regulation of membrane protease activity
MDELFSHVVHWTWWIIAVVLIVLEMFAPGTFFLWMGASAGIVGVALFLFPELAWELQLTLFATLSIVAIVLARRYLQKNKGAHSKLSQRGKRYIGRTVTVAEAIINGLGKVRIEDTLWRVRGRDTVIGQQVKIVAIEGATFEVESIASEPGESAQSSG